MLAALLLVGALFLWLHATWRSALLLTIAWIVFGHDPSAGQVAVIVGASFAPAAVRAAWRTRAGLLVHLRRPPQRLPVIR